MDGKNTNEKPKHMKSDKDGMKVLGENDQKRKGARRLILPIVLLIASALLSAAARYTDGFAPWYSTTVYPMLVSSIGRIAGIFPFSVSEMLCALLPVFIIADIVRCRRKPLRILLHLFILISVLVFLYTANCGVNYYRDPFVPPETYGEAEFTDEELAEFCGFVVDRLCECYPDGESAEVYPARDELVQTARSSMVSLAADHEELAGFFPKPKMMTFLSKAFSAMGVSGIYSPFTIEANINGDMPDMHKPFTACHELAHLRGYMNEGEANYIGWLTCIGSDDPAFRRSGWLIAWTYAGSALRRTDPEAFESLYEKLPDGAVRELEENHEYWVSHETRASEMQDRLNDQYLRAHGQKNGIADYGMLTVLMLIWYYGN